MDKVFIEVLSCEKTLQQYHLLASRRDGKYN